MNAVRLPALVVVVALLVGAFVFKAQDKQENSRVDDPISYSELSFDSSAEKASGDVWYDSGMSPWQLYKPIIYNRDTVAVFFISKEFFCAITNFRTGVSY